MADLRQALRASGRRRPGAADVESGAARVEVADGPAPGGAETRRPDARQLGLGTRHDLGHDDGHGVRGGPVHARPARGALQAPLQHAV